MSKVQPRAVPVNDATTDQSVTVVRGQAGGRLFYLANL
jgi:hypothetical protein